MNEPGNAEKQEVGRWANNRIENSHLPLRRRERAMPRFRQMKALQKFAFTDADVSLERHQPARLPGTTVAPSAEWRMLARWPPVLGDLRASLGERLRLD